MSMEFNLYEETIDEAGNVYLKNIVDVDGNIPTRFLLNLMETTMTDSCENYLWLQIETLQLWFAENNHNEAVGKYLDAIDYEDLPENLFVKFS